MEIAGNDIKTYAMDHHGLVAAVCKDLGIAGKIDKRLGKRQVQASSTAKLGVQNLEMREQLQAIKLNVQ